MPRTYMTIYSIWIMLGWHSDRFPFYLLFWRGFGCFVSALRGMFILFFCLQRRRWCREGRSGGNKFGSQGRK
ncbi:hypothetical protein DL95DRAFT_387660 [Leptodontidium sp. 2 PMI_412]|nr:hypothetical protein DL95DRAFT_387660 [Leptodontidium sp. 2 PMI_412]